MFNHKLLSSFLLVLHFSLSSVLAATSYPSEFVDPDYVLAEDFPAYLQLAQRVIARWAEEFSETGPWTVTSKPFTAPSDDIHDYMSLAPYWWPNCSSVGNTTELTEQEVWEQCPYESRDGEFNPDARIVNDIQKFDNLSDAVLYNSIAWVLNGRGSNVYSANNAKFLSAWFIDSETRMNPNLNYAQVIRGPGRMTGTHTGVLDLKGMAKIASGVLIMRKGGCPDWTTELDDQLQQWMREYIGWLETAPLALEEAFALNNHGSYYFVQLSALKLMVNDNPGAVNVSRTYFEGIFQGQIEANGEQPLEAARTRPYHYRAYNLAAAIAAARIAEYAGSEVSFWNATSAEGATIQTAVDFAMSIPASESGEDKYAAELHPPVAAAAAVYGDPERKYQTYLTAANNEFVSEPYFFWNQPFAAFQVSSDDDGGDGEGGSNSSTDTNGSYAIASTTWVTLTLMACLGIIPYILA